MSKVSVNNISLYYEIHGEGEPIVFIAGFSSDHTIWKEVVQEFAKSYQVILFDNRGSGQSEVPQGPYSIEDMAQDVLELCAKIGIKKSHFVGNSMGGFILQHLALKNPELVKSAVIGNSNSTINTCFHFYVDAQLELLKANAPLRSLIKASCSWVFSYSFLSIPGVLDYLIQVGLDNPYPFSIKGYEGQYAALEGFDARKIVKDIRVPVLVISGEQDLIFSAQTVKSFAEQIPDAHYYCFENCGHLPMLEYPHDFVTVVNKFIEGCI